LKKVKRIRISENIYATGTVVTAATGFANEANMKYLHENNINGYIPDNKLRSRDPKFADQKIKYAKRHQQGKYKRKRTLYSASEFDFDLVKLICVCPAGETLTSIGERADPNGNPKIFFSGRL
jgi:hypothetical protein